MLADRLRTRGRRAGITWLGYNWNSDNLTDGSYDISFTGVSAGANDLVILVYGFATSNSGDHTFSVPSGYTKLLDLYQANTKNTHLCVAYRFLTATPSSPVTIPLTGVAGISQTGVLMAFRGVNQTTPFDVTSTTDSSSADISINPPSIVPTTAGSWILAVGGLAGKDDGTFPGYNPPSGQTNLIGVGGGRNLGNPNPPYFAVRSGTHTTWTAGSYDPGVWTADYLTSIGGWVAATMALRPA